MAIHDEGWKQIQDLFSDKGVKITQTESRILDILLGRQRIVSKDEVIDRLWGDREDGGPLCALRNLDVHVFRLKKHLRSAPIPWKLITHFSMGLQLRYDDNPDLN